MASVNPSQSSLLKDGWTLKEISHEIPLTHSGREVVKEAQRIAGLAGSAHVEPDHLLLAVLGLKGGMATRALRDLGKDPAAVLSQPGGSMDPGQRAGHAPASTEIGQASRYILFNGLKEAQLLGHYRVDALHILLGLLYKGTPTAEQLARAGISLFELRQYMQKPLPGEGGLRRRPLSFDGAIRVSPIFAIPVAAFVGAALGLYLGPASSLVFLLTAAFVVGGWITSVCIHEFLHAAVAYLGGDRSVADSGYLTLNPLRYTDPLLSIVVPLVLVFLTGFGLPGGAVYINSRVLRTRWWDTFSSVAGPLGNALFALVLIAPFWLGWRSLLTEQTVHFWNAVAFLAFVEVSAVIFNLLPIPGIDGFGALAPWLPPDVRVQAARLGAGGLWLIWFLIFWSGGGGLWHVIYQAAEALRVPIAFVASGRGQLLP